MFEKRIVYLFYLLRNVTAGAKSIFLIRNSFFTLCVARAGVFFLSEKKKKKTRSHTPNKLETEKTERDNPLKLDNRVLCGRKRCFRLG